MNRNKMRKEVYLIRHAQSEANASYDLDDPTIYYDPRITNSGKQQAVITRKLLANIDFDLIVCSPLTRALQTFECIFPRPIQNTVVLSLVREYLNDSADVGSQPNTLKKEFANFDFYHISNFLLKVHQLNIFRTFLLSFWRISEKMYFRNSFQQFLF